jgi:UDP-MurNAc hydroxylase
MIKTTLIGHACLLIQTKETTILSDPVWFDYLWEEINVLCPSIALEKDKIPPVDVLNLSHRHQDHFDVRTLAYLVNSDRILKPNATILAPNDPLLLEILHELEFKNIQIVSDFCSIKIKDATFTPTPSLLKDEDGFVEHGLIVSDGEVSVWNQVDTVVNPEIIDHIRNQFGQLDFVHSRFLPLMEGRFSFHKSLNLPFELYGACLNVIKSLEPKFVVPGSAAFRHRDEFGFLNRYTFPTTQDQFVSDLSSFCPDVENSLYFPGDVAHIEPNSVRIEKQSSEFVKVLEEDSHRIIFKPIMEVPPIRTRTIDLEQHKSEMETVKDFIQNRFMDMMLKSDMMLGWRHWKIVYQLEVFGQAGSEIWSVDFGMEELTIQEGDIGKINLYEGISSSELVALIEKRTSWDFVSLCGNYRTFNNVYRVAEGRFEYYPGEEIDHVLEPLMDIFPSNAEMDREKYMKDVRRWKGKA